MKVRFQFVDEGWGFGGDGHRKKLDPWGESK